MNRIILSAAMLLAATTLSQSGLAADDKEAVLQAGFGETDITPEIGDKPVYMAGFGQNRKATAIHDRLKARAVVFKHGDVKIALVSVDLVGLFHANVVRVREKLPGFRYVLVSSTHNHEGPDTLGLWGPNPFKSGIDRDYVNSVEEKIVQAVHDADKAAKPMTARIGTATAPELLHDSREPYVKHDELVALECRQAPSPQPLSPAAGERGWGEGSDKPAILLVQWNCHPETLQSKNTEISSDFVGATVKYLQQRHDCPVIYLTGTVGGLMTSLNVEVKDETGKILADGTFEKTQRYGQLVGQLAERALANGRQIKLTPFDVRSREVFLPIDNKLYKMGHQLGVLERQAYLWTGDPTKGQPADLKDFDKPVSMRRRSAGFVSASWRRLRFRVKSIRSWSSTKCRTRPTRGLISPMPRSSRPSTSRCVPPTT